jgi:uncharacterized protein (TIGR02001 family)
VPAINLARTAACASILVHKTLIAMVKRFLAQLVQDGTRRGKRIRFDKPTNKEIIMHQVKKSLALAILMTGFAGGVAQAQTTPAPAPAPAPAAAPAAAAPAAEPASPLTFNVGVWSQYIFRGLSQSDYKPALQGGIDYAHDSGLYVGTWASNINWLRDFQISSGRVELDLYGGWKQTFSEDYTIDFGFLRYEYPGSVQSGATNPNTNELYTAVSWKFVTLKYSHAISNAFGTPESKHTYYLDLTAAIPIAETWTLTLHGGRQNYHGPSSDLASYNDFKGEIAKDFGNGISAGGGVTLTDANKDFYTPPGKRSIAKDTGYVFVKYNF